MNIQKKAVDLTDLAVGILILGILVSIGSTILIGMRDSRLTSLSTQNFNEAITPDDGGTAFSKAYFKEIINCYNGTTGEKLIQSGNYTITTGTGIGTITNLTSEFPNAWNCNYTTYNTTRADYTLPNSSAVGLGEYGNWFKILVIVGVASVILSLIFISFGKGSQGQGTGGSY